MGTYFKNSTTVEKEIRLGAEIRREVYQLRNNYNISHFAEGILAMHSGRPTKVPSKYDRRRSQIPVSWIKAFRGLLSMFAVGDDFNFTKFREKFTQNAFRETSWAEISRIGNGNRYGGVYTKSQITSFLSLFKRAGYLERKRFFNPGKNKSRLFIRLRADRIIADIEKFRRLKNSPSLPPKPKKNSKSTMTMHQCILITKRPVPDLDHSPDHAAIVSSTQKERGMACGHDSFSIEKEKTPDEAPIPPLEIGDPTLRVITASVQDIFYDETLNHKHIAILRRYVSSGRGRDKMTVENIQKYVRLRAQSAGHGWEFDCKLEFFLQAWPSILVTVQRDEITSDSALGNSGSILKGIRDNDGDLMQIVNHELEMACHAAVMTGRAIDDLCLGYQESLNRYIAFKVAGMQDSAAKVLSWRKDDFKQRLKGQHLLALEIRQKCPEITEELGFTNDDWRDIRLDVEYNREYLINLQTRAAYFGVEVRKN